MDPSAWYEFLAGALSASMPRAMLVRALSATISVDPQALEAALDTGAVCKTVGQEISLPEFLTNGLYAWALQHEHVRCSQLGHLPDLAQREEWFRHWNTKNDGKLSRGELARGILCSFKVGSLEKDRMALYELKLDELWEAWCSQQMRRFGCCDPKMVTCKEFTGGFGDLLEKEFGRAGDVHRSQPCDLGGQPALSPSSRSTSNSVSVASIQSLSLTTAASDPFAFDGCSHQIADLNTTQTTACSD